jgi:hypothetical protein
MAKQTTKGQVDHLNRRAKASIETAIQFKKKNKKRIRKNLKDMVDSSR